MFNNNKKKNKKKYTIFAILIMMAMISGGYILGTRIGQDSLDESLKKTGEEPGYQTMQATGQDDKEIVGHEVPAVEVTTQDTLLVFERYYTSCNDKRVEERKAEGYEVGLSRQDIRLKFPEWDIYEFSTEKVILTKEIHDYCTGHFILKDRDGMVVIYMPSEEGDEYKGFEETQVPTEILPPDVQDEIQRGLVMDSLEDVEHFMENLES